jgi:hypothetical protein
LLLADSDAMALAIDMPCRIPSHLLPAPDCDKIERIESTRAIRLVRSAARIVVPLPPNGLRRLNCFGLDQLAAAHDRLVQPHREFVAGQRGDSDGGEFWIFIRQRFDRRSHPHPKWLSNVAVDRLKQLQRVATFWRFQFRLYLIQHRSDFRHRYSLISFFLRKKKMKDMKGMKGMKGGRNLAGTG